MAWCTECGNLGYTNGLHLPNCPCYPAQQAKKAMAAEQHLTGIILARWDDIIALRAKITRLRAALEAAPESVPPTTGQMTVEDWRFWRAYGDWYFGQRQAALGLAEAG